MVILNNAQVFDGRRKLPGRHCITLDGNRIAAVAGTQAALADNVIDVDGMTVMPGMITSHLHPEFYRFTLEAGRSGERPGHELPPGVLMAIGVRTCRVLLESGFTGYVGAGCAHDIDAQLKIAVAEDIVPGPRIRACSHHVGTTADLNDPPKWWRRFRTPGIDLFADGPDALRALVREEIRRGAETIKIFASSGRGFDGRTIRNMAHEEIASIVNTAHERAVKVRAHVCDKAMMLECIGLGVDILDHGDDIDDECIAAMVKAGTFWVPSLVYPKTLIDLGWADEKTKAQYAHVCAMLPRAQQAGVRILIGDDYSGVFRDVLDDDPLDHQVGCYGREFAFYAGIDGLTATDVLCWGTRNAGELLVDRPEKVGVIEPGALADLIVIDGDPLADLTVLSRPRESLKAVIRDGAFVIDRLP